MLSAAPGAVLPSIKLKDIFAKLPFCVGSWCKYYIKPWRRQKRIAIENINSRESCISHVQVSDSQGLSSEHQELPEFRPVSRTGPTGVTTGPLPGFFFPGFRPFSQPRDLRAQKVTQHPGRAPRYLLASPYSMANTPSQQS